MCDFGHSLITEQPILVRGPLCRDKNNNETVLFSMFFAFVLYGHKAEECNMTTYSARGESVHILYKLHWCVMKTSFLFRKASLCLQLAYGDTNLGWTSSAHRNRNYTEYVIVRVILFSFCQVYMVKKRRHYGARKTALNIFHGHWTTRDWIQHTLDN